jgi:hypothetical protein
VRQLSVIICKVLRWLPILCVHSDALAALSDLERHIDPASQFVESIDGVGRSFTPPLQGGSPSAKRFPRVSPWAIFDSSLREELRWVARRAQDDSV